MRTIKTEVRGNSIEAPTPKLLAGAQLLGAAENPKRHSSSCQARGVYQQLYPQKLWISFHAANEKAAGGNLSAALSLSLLAYSVRALLVRPLTGRYSFGLIPSTAGSRSL